MVTGQAPGIFKNAGRTDLKSTGATPAKLFTLTTAMALKGSFRSSGFRAKIGFGVFRACFHVGFRSLGQIDYSKPL